MKIGSIKNRITIWYTIFIVIIIVFLVGVLLLSQRLSSQNYYEDQLNNTMNWACASIGTFEDALALPSQNEADAHITILDEDGNKLAGRRSFSIALEKDKIQVSRNLQGNIWYVLDRPVELQDGRNLWLRCYISSAVSEQNNQTIIILLSVIIPLMLLAVVLGGRILTQRALQPLESIIQLTENISNTSNLNERVSFTDHTNEVGRLIISFNRMLTRLEKSMENEKRFISDASHELRTPIGVIYNQSEFALNSAQTIAEKDAALQVIRDRSQRAGEMLSQMLLLSRMDYQKLPLNLEHIDLSELIEQAAQELELTAGERGIKIECNIEKSIFYTCDELLILRAFTNLIENAIQYGRENGHIWLYLHRVDNVITFTVSDDGIGISEADLPKIWKRFYQANKSGERSSGSGLGLAITQWIVQAHGGTITASSVLNQGTSFTIRFPCTDTGFH